MKMNIQNLKSMIDNLELTIYKANIEMQDFKNYFSEINNSSIFNPRNKDNLNKKVKIEVQNSIELSDDFDPFGDNEYLTQRTKINQNNFKLPIDPNLNSHKIFKTQKFDQINHNKKQQQISELKSDNINSKDQSYDKSYNSINKINHDNSRNIIYDENNKSQINYKNFQKYQQVTNKFNSKHHSNDAKNQKLEIRFHSHYNQENKMNQRKSSQKLSQKSRQTSRISIDKIEKSDKKEPHYDNEESKFEIKIQKEEDKSDIFNFLNNKYIKKMTLNLNNSEITSNSPSNQTSALQQKMNQNSNHSRPKTSDNNSNSNISAENNLNIISGEIKNESESKILNQNENNQTKDEFRRISIQSVQESESQKSEDHFNDVNEQIKNENNGLRVGSRKVLNLKSENNSQVSNYSQSIVASNNLSMLDKFDENDLNFKQLLFEVNNQPKTLIMIDSNKNIMFQNQNLCINLFQDRSELIQTQITNILHSDTENLDFFLDDIIGRFVFENANSSEVGEHHLTFLDKENNKVPFHVRFIKRSIQSAETLEHFIVFFMDHTLNERESAYSFDPRNVYQLIFAIIIGACLLFLIFQVPQDISFGSAESAQFNLWLDIIVTSIFTLDICINFLLAYEDEDGKQIFDNRKIIISQISGTFLFDVVATVPFEYIFTFVTFNTNIIKSIRIVKVFKLIKILRISKQIAFMTQKGSFIEKELGRDTWMTLKKSSGFFELMLQNLYILVGAHQYTILFYQIKILVSGDSEEWLDEYYVVPLSGIGTFNTQLFLLGENVKTALGLAVISPTNKLEISLNMIWMFIGLSLFGYGIGNISSQLNNVQQEELEYMNSVTYFKQLCENNDLDNRIYNVISSDIDNYYNSFSDKKFYSLGKILSNQTLIQLETALYKDFVNKFRLFGLLNITVVRYIKLNSRTISKSFKLGQGNNLNEIILITTGRLMEQSDSMAFINQFGANGIQGMELFKSQCTLKQRIDFDAIYEEAKAIKSEQEQNGQMEDQLESFEEIKLALRTRLKGRTVQQVNDDIPILQEEDTIKVSIMTNLVASADIEQVTLPFKFLEDIFLSDFESFMTFWKQYLADVEPISISEREKSNLIMQQFRKHHSSAIMITSDATVHDINTILLENSLTDFSSMLGNNFTDQIESSNNQNKNDIITKLNNNELQEMIINLNHMRIAFHFDKLEQHKILRSNQNVSFDIENSHFQNLKKSMLEVKILQFDVFEIK